MQALRSPKRQNGAKPVTLRLVHNGPPSPLLRPDDSPRVPRRVLTADDLHVPDVAPQPDDDLPPLSAQDVAWELWQGMTPREVRTLIGQYREARRGYYAALAVAVGGSLIVILLGIWALRTWGVG